MKVKRLFAGLLSAVLLMTLLPVGASAADSDVIGVFQGPDIYVTVRPFTPNAEGYDVDANFIAEFILQYYGFNDGLVTIRGSYDNRHGYRVGYFNTDGELQAESWQLGPSITEVRQSGDDRIIFWDGESSTSDDLGLPDINEVLYGYMDTHGNVVIEPQYSGNEINAFHG